MNKRAAISLLALMGVAIGFQNCGQTPLGALGLSSDEESSEETAENVVSNPIALFSGEQLFKTMASVTSINLSPDSNNPVNSEYNARLPVLATGYQLNLVTSPMLIASTNMASRFCDEALRQTDARARLFPGIDFTRAIETFTGGVATTNLTDDLYLGSVNSMSQAFWGRAPSSEESSLLLDAKTEFVGQYTDAERRTANSSTRLMLFACTAMLSSFDTLSF